jgi:hypothetical protein
MCARRRRRPPFVLTGPRSYSPPLVCARLRSFAGPRLSPLVYPRSVVLGRPPFVLAPARLCSFPFFCWSPFVPAHLSPLGCTGWPSCSFVPFVARSYPSPFVCWSPFVPARLCPLGCAGSRSVVVVPATSCACLAFVRACLCSFMPLVCVSIKYKVSAYIMNKLTLYIINYQPV